MPTPTQRPLTLRVFLSSPGDVNEERKIAYQEIDKFISNHSVYKDKVHLEAIGWDREGHYVPLEATRDPQPSIDERMPKSSDCDISLFLFWSRMGTPMNPDKYIKPEAYQYEVGGEAKSQFYSGTEWEFVAAMEEARKNNINYPRIYLFRRTEKAQMDVDMPIEKVIELHKQNQKVDQFFKQLKDKGGFIKHSFDMYEEPEEFREKLKAILQVAVKELLHNPPKQLLDRGQETQEKKGLEWVGSPFPGLRAFTQADEPIFFGRDREIEQLKKKLEEHHFVAVIGASGAGKSSLVRAGLLPSLQRDGIRKYAAPKMEHGDENNELLVKSSDWLIIKMTPGEVITDGFNNPFHALNHGILQTFPKQPLIQDSPSLIEDKALAVVEANTARNLFLEGDQQQYQAALKELSESLEQLISSLLAAAPPTGELLFLIDQFEETFTLVDDEDERQAFIAFLEVLADCERVRILLTMRADFYHYGVEYEQFAELLRSGTFTLAPPGLAALHEMIRNPAEITNLEFEENLLEKILVDTDENPGGLPLMAYLLDQLYERRIENKKMTLAVYEELGGVAGAIGKRADRIIEEMKDEFPNIEDLLHGLFKELVEVNDLGAPTRRLAELSSFADNPSIMKLIARLADARLLVTSLRDKGEEDEEGTPTQLEDREQKVEVAHEALLREWKMLGSWISTRKEDFILRSKVEDAAADWQSRKEDPAFLWSHEQLQPWYEAMERFGYKPPDFSETMQKFMIPEVDRIIDELTSDETTHARRKEIGDRLAVLGDPRRGIGLDSYGIPDIVWSEKRVPKGEVELEDAEGSIEAGPFYVAKYPISLLQFKAFIDAKDGYMNTEWWEGLGLKPWQHKPFNQIPEVPNHPALWISWYQSIAFCRWLSSKLGYEVRVPNEWEWQQAATGGNPEYRYPWGPDWEDNRCNSVEAGLNTILSIGLYPNGQSPVGAEDMSGNVVEWCYNRYDLEKDEDVSEEVKRTTRGGAYFIAVPLKDKYRDKEKDAVTTTTRLADPPAAPAIGRIRVSLRIIADSLPDEVKPDA